MKRARSKVTEQQQAYVDGVLEGKSKQKAAELAGYAHAQCPDNSLTVQNEIQKARDQLTDLTQIRRVNVVDGILDGIAMAKMMSDPANVIKGWTEIGKILGHYAPEVKNVNLNLSTQRMRSKLEALSDEELLALIDGRPPSDDITDVEPKG